jgi:hypothetical protein
MGKSTITFTNDTDMTVTFGLYNALGDHRLTQQVEKNHTVDKDMDHSDDARVVAAWVNDDTIYPNDNSPYTKGYYFDSANDYQVTLSTTGLTIASVSATGTTAK